MQLPQTVQLCGTVQLIQVQRVEMEWQLHLDQFKPQAAAAVVDLM
jgi:hypothetical protein